MRNVIRRCPGDGALDILLPASPEGASLYLTSDRGPGDRGEDSREALRWTARLAADTGECPSGAVEPGRASLPFAEAVFERVVLSIRHGWPTGSRAQDLAAEIGRVLAPGGELLVMVPGRLGYRRVAGVVRPPACAGGVAARAHGRWQAGVRLLSGWQGAPSRRALERFLTAAGLPASEWFHPRRDSHGGIVEVEPLWSRKPQWLQYRVSPGRNPFRRSSWLVDEYAVRAGPAPLGESVVEQCLASTAARLADPDGPTPCPRIENYLVTAKEKVVLLLRLGERRLVMRIPLTEAALAGCRRNLNALRAIADDPERRGLAPLPLDDGAVGSGHCYTVESRFDGEPATRGAGEARILEQVEGILQRLNPQSRLRRVQLRGESYARLVEQPLGRVLAVLPESDNREWLERCFSQGLEGRHMTLGISHGDFSLSNIHVRDGRVCGLIDWDDSALEGLPIEDALSHLSSRLVRRGDNFASALLGLASRDALTAAENGFLQRCYAYFDIDPTLHPALTLLFWIRIIDAQRDFTFAAGASYRQSRIDPVAAAVIADERFRALAS